MNKNYYILILICFLFSQNYNGPDDPASDPSAIKQSWMDGNRVYLSFKNTSELSDWEPGGLDNVSIWPNDGTGTRMVDGVGLLIGAKVYIYDDENPTTIDTTILDNWSDIINSDIKKHEVYFLQTQYREEMDQNPLGTLNWGFYPIFGYFNSYQDYPAMSDDPNTWPSDGWPWTGNELHRPGKWDGRFGEGVTYADLETYFVINDAQDQEHLQGPDYKYYPRPGKYIQNDASVQSGHPWGGLGLRVEVRGFQWNNPLVRDALFWEYNITNISDYDINEVAFGYWVDNAIGGESTIDDDVGYFDTDLDLSYSWDYNGIGEGGNETGIMGFAYLESPGNIDDNIDTDGDGLIDERRDNDGPGTLICATCGIDDLIAFKNFYGYTDDDLKEHWSSDEDQDWVSSIIDENGNCIPNDDLGTDGIGPSDIDYEGPDEDGTECNQQPDCDWGQSGDNCEPNFNSTDVSESDMIGLTTFQLFPVDSHSEQVDNSSKWFYNDEVIFNMMIEDTLMNYSALPANLIELFATGHFKLSKGRTERISMAEIHSFDYLTGTPGGTGNTEQNAPALFELKKTVQLIYETDYRFAQPPEVPTLNADAKDGKIILTWNSISEESRDPFLPDSVQYDFEGYKIYKSTDKYLKDSQIITDGYGNPMFNSPIFQCDKVDGITGFSDFATISGTSYYLGDDSGIQHHFIDEDVINGRTYYYALVAYDYGLNPYGALSSGIPPSENNVIIELDENEYVISTGPNVVQVQPVAPSAGYIQYSADDFYFDNKVTYGSGDIDVNIYAPGKIKNNEAYYVTFINDTLYNPQNNDSFPQAIVTSGVKIFKDVEGELDLIYSESSGNDSYNNPNYINSNIVESSADFDGDGFNDVLCKDPTDDIDDCSNIYSTLNTSEPIITDVFDGLQLTINQNVEYPQLINQGWKNLTNPNAQIFITPYPDILHRQSLISPLDATIHFDSNIIFTNEMQYSLNVYDENYENLSPSELLLNESFDFYVKNKLINLTELGCSNAEIEDESTCNSIENCIWINECIAEEELMSMIVHDINNNGTYEKFEDRILVGTKGDFLFNDQIIEDIWINTNFILEFSGLDDFQIPSNGDIYEINFERPFWQTDTLKFTTKAPQLEYSSHNLDMEKIKVVPNPYIGTNLLEEAIYSSNFNQRRKLMFTHLPSQCVIKIFTSSGVLVDKIEVNNAIDDGVAYWDLLNNESMEVASGMYFYHVKSNITGKEKAGKFAIIK